MKNVHFSLTSVKRDNVAAVVRSVVNAGESKWEHHRMPLWNWFIWFIDYIKIISDMSIDWIETFVLAFDCNQFDRYLILSVFHSIVYKCALCMFHSLFDATVPTRGLPPHQLLHYYFFSIFSIWLESVIWWKCPELLPVSDGNNHHLLLFNNFFGVLCALAVRTCCSTTDSCAADGNYWWNMNYRCD